MVVSCNLAGPAWGQPPRDISKEADYPSSILMTMLRLPEDGRPEHLGPSSSQAARSSQSTPEAAQTLVRAFNRSLIAAVKTSQVHCRLRALHTKGVMQAQVDDEIEVDIGRAYAMDQPSSLRGVQAWLLPAAAAMFNWLLIVPCICLPAHPCCPAHSCEIRRSAACPGKELCNLKSYQLVHIIMLMVSDMNLLQLLANMFV